MTPVATPEAIDHPAREDIELTAVLHALSDPVRLEIVAALASRPDACPTGMIHVPVAKSTCTHHFRVLRESGLIAAEQTGREWRYRLEVAALARLQRDWFEQFAPLVERSLLNLKRRVEAPSRRRR